MRRQIQAMLVRCAADIVQRRPAPKRITTSGAEAEANDCYSMRIYFGQEEDFYCYVNKLEDGYLEVKADNDGRFDAPACLYDLYSRDLNVYIIHYLGVGSYKYKYLIWFVFSQYLMVPYLSITIRRIVRQLHKLRNPRRKSRINVLNALVSARLGEEGGIANNDGYVHLIELMMVMYGKYIFEHPKCDQYLCHLNMHLDSLVCSGDIRSENQITFRAEGKALETIARFEEDQEKWRIESRRGNIILFFSFILALNAAVSIVVAIS